MCYCIYCGHQIPEGSSTCPSCGKPAPARGTPETPQETPAKKPGRKRLWLIIGVSVACVALLVGGILGFLYLRDVLQRDSYVADLTDWLRESRRTEERYILDDDAQRELDKLEQSIRSGIDEGKSVSALKKRRSQLEAYFEDLAASNTEQLNTYVNGLNGQPLLFAGENDLATIERYGSTVQSLIGEGQYREALASVQEWERYVSTLNAVYEDYTVTVNQYDISDFPTVRVYLDVTDTNGNFVDGLPSSAFYVNEGRNIDGAFTRATVINAAKLNENAGISISLAADISGSMSGNMGQAKQAMAAFVNTVQFSKGDEIELTEFNQSSYICQSFTNQPQPILNSINAMQADGQTRLYDTLLSEIERIQSRSNAKCVIGFTDGYDNVSVNSAQDVVDAAVSRNVPVFLIGIGSSCDASTLRYIAQSTGGSYQNINSISSLASVYNSIYRQEKEVYMVEYTVSGSDNFKDNCYSDIYIRTDQGTGGYVKNFTFASQDFFELMYSKFLIAGVDCQTKGERNLLDSGLIVTTPEAYADPNCVAAQSQASIDSGGVGSNNSSTFLVLVDHSVLSVEPDGDGYIVYGVSNYNISKIMTYSKISNTMEKEFINSRYGEPAGDTKFWIEENRSNYEKLKLVKDTDGKWKFLTRVYERKDGEKSVVVNEVYTALPQ